MDEKLEQLLNKMNDKIDQLLERVEKIEHKLHTHSKIDTRDKVYGPGSNNYNRDKMPTNRMPSPTSGLAEQINKMREELMGKYMKDGKPIMPDMPSTPDVPGMGGTSVPGVGGMGVPGAGMGAGMAGMPGVGMPDLATNMAQGIAETMKRTIPKPEAENVKIKEEDEEDGE